MKAGRGAAVGCIEQVQACCTRAFALRAVVRGVVHGGPRACEASLAAPFSVIVSGSGSPCTAVGTLAHVYQFGQPLIIVCPCLVAGRAAVAIHAYDVGRCIVVQSGRR